MILQQLKLRAKPWPLRWTLKDFDEPRSSSYWKAWSLILSGWSMIRILLLLDTPYLTQHSWGEQSVPSPCHFGTFAAAWSICIAQYHQLTQYSGGYSGVLSLVILCSSPETGTRSAFAFTSYYVPMMDQVAGLVSQEPTFRSDQIPFQKEVNT